MTNLTLTKIAISDIATLQNISNQTFLETFATFNTQANMTKYLEDSLSIQRLTDENKHKFLLGEYLQTDILMKMKL